MAGSNVAHQRPFKKVQKRIRRWREQSTLANGEKASLLRQRNSRLLLHTVAELCTSVIVNVTRAGIVAVLIISATK